MNHDPPVKWTALGDSYTAAPGAGKKIGPETDPLRRKNCYRTEGSYTFKLHENFPFIQTHEYSMMACTGDTTKEVLDLTEPDIVANQNDFMVMTIGGNDIGFTGIAIACLSPYPTQPYGTCEEAQGKARAIMEDDDFERKIHTVYDKLFAKMEQRHQYQIYHIAYSRFFAAETNWCNEQSISVVPEKWPGASGFRPKLTKILRHQLNDLSDDLNHRLQLIARSYSDRQRTSRRPGWDHVTPKLVHINPDRVIGKTTNRELGLYDKHRFCEEEDNGEFEGDNIWFFSPRSSRADSAALVGPEAFRDVDPEACLKDPKRETDVEFAYACGIANAYKDPEAERLPKLPSREDFNHAFHPTGPGYEAIKHHLFNVIQDKRPDEQALGCNTEVDGQDKAFFDAAMEGDGKEFDFCAGAKGAGDEESPKGEEPGKYHLFHLNMLSIPPYSRHHWQIPSPLTDKPYQIRGKGPTARSRKANSNSSSSPPNPTIPTTTNLESLA